MGRVLISVILELFRGGLPSSPGLSMKCQRQGCEGNRADFSTLCHKCADLRDSAIIVGVCGGLCVFIVALAKLGRLI